MLTQQHRDTTRSRTNGAPYGIEPINGLYGHTCPYAVRHPEITRSTTARRNMVYFAIFGQLNTALYNIPSQSPLQNCDAPWATYRTSKRRWANYMVKIPVDYTTQQYNHWWHPTVAFSNFQWSYLNESRNCPHERTSIRTNLWLLKFVTLSCIHKR